MTEPYWSADVRTQRRVLLAGVFNARLSAEEENRWREHAASSTEWRDLCHAKARKDAAIYHNSTDLEERVDAHQAALGACYDLAARWFADLDAERERRHADAAAKIEEIEAARAATTPVGTPKD